MTQERCSDLQRGTESTKSFCRSIWQGSNSVDLQRWISSSSDKSFCDTVTLSERQKKPQPTSRHRTQHATKQQQTHEGDHDRFDEGPRHYREGKPVSFLTSPQRSITWNTEEDKLSDNFQNSYQPQDSRTTCGRRGQSLHFGMERTSVPRKNRKIPKKRLEIILIRLQKLPNLFVKVLNASRSLYAIDSKCRI